MEPVAFKTLFNLLESGLAGSQSATDDQGGGIHGSIQPERLTVGQLATAIEEVGIHGWDRFGRYGKHSRTSDVAKEALEGLASFYANEVTFWQQVEDTPIQSQEEMADVLAFNAVEAARDHPELAIHRLGWPEDQLPVMPNATTSLPPRRTPRREATQDSPALYVLGALLSCLSELRSEGKTMRMPSEDILNGKMTDAFPNVRWISRTTIHNCFVDAKKAVEKARLTA